MRGELAGYEDWPAYLQERPRVAGDSVTTAELKIEVVSIMGRRLRKLKVSRINQEVTG